MEVPSRKEKIDNFCINALNNDTFPGVSYAFSRWHKGGYKRESNYYGYAELSPEKRALTRHSVFDLASLTKVLVTVPLILILFDKNKINSQTELKDIYPSCPRAQIVFHVGGVGSYNWSHISTYPGLIKVKIHRTENN